MALEFFLHGCNLQGFVDEGIAEGARMVPKMSPDGRFWELHQELGDLYRKKAADGHSVEAMAQYTVALNSYLAQIRRDAVFQQQLGGVPESLPLDQIESQVKKLKEAIVAAGGKADPAKSELGFLSEIFAKPPAPPLPEALTKESVIERVRLGSTNRDQYPRPEDRVRALAEQKAWFLGKVKDLAPDRRDQAIEPRRYLTLLLALAANREEDAAARKAILAESASLATYRPSADAPGADELAGVRKQVDDLVAKAAASPGDAKQIAALQSEVGKLPSSAIEFIADYLCRKDLPAPIQTALMAKLRSPVPCPRAFPKLVELLNVNPSRDVCQHACDAIQAIMFVCPMDADGVFTESKSASKAEK
jgi:hypothetical protein